MVYLKCIIILILTKQLLQVLDKVKLKLDKRLNKLCHCQQISA
jgi:hypothetical protein